MKTWIDQSGLLVEGDSIALSTSLKLHKNYLHDQITDAKHKLHPAAYKVLVYLRKGCSYSSLQDMCIQNGLTNDNFEEIVFFMNNIGGFNIKRSMAGHISHSYRTAKLLLWGIRPPWHVKRYPVSLTSLAIALAQAMKMLIGALALLALLAFGVNLLPGFIIGVSLCFILGVYFSTFAHEAGHAWIISRNAQPMAIVHRGLRIGILHRTLPARKEYISALAGPMLGICTAILIGTVGSTFWKDTSFIIGLLVASMHLFSWLPGNGDGNVIWHRLKINQFDEEVK